MRLFAPDLFRNFSIGFAIGALMIVGINADRWSEEIASPAHAAVMPEAPQPSAEFIIAPGETAR
jgi:hypothetical protein